MSAPTESVEIPAPQDFSRGWRPTTLGEIGEYINGRGFKKSEWSDKGLPIIRIQNLTGTGKELNYYDGDINERHVINPGDLLISWAATLGAYIWQGPRAALNQHIFKVRSFVEKKFHFYLIKNILDDLYRQTHGSGMVHITKSKFDSMTVLVPETEDEQRLIVAEIEKQFSRLDEAVTNLKRTRANLKRYKAAVLKAAVEGKLTEDWRKQHSDVEPASKLLERILIERREKWTGRGKYPEPTLPENNKLPSLPKGWIWATADQFCDFITKGTTPSAKKLLEVTGDVPFLKVYNLTFTGRLDLSIKPAFVDRTVHEGELKRSKIMKGDVLINIVGPPLGQVAIVPDSLAEANINQAIARLRVLVPMSNRYVAIALMSESIMGWAIERAKTTAGQANLTLELCRALPFPLPPTEEQELIVSEVERRLSVIDELETIVNANLTRANGLRQTILKQAFEGTLVE